MLPLAEPLAVPQRATENPANLNQGDASFQHHHTASSPHIQLSPGDSIGGIPCPNTITLPGYTHILNSNTHAFDLHTRLYMNTLNPINRQPRQDLVPPYQQRKNQPGPREVPSMNSNTSTEQRPAPQPEQRSYAAALKGPNDTHSTNLREIKDMLNLICSRLMD